MNPKHYIGKVCDKHPEILGNRLKSTGRCIKCHNERVAKGQRTKRAKLKLEVIRHYSGGAMSCAHCGIADVEVLTIDHANNDGAAHRRECKSLHIHVWLHKNNYPSGYRVLCFNCNHKAWLRFANIGVEHE